MSACCNSMKQAEHAGALYLHEAEGTSQHAMAQMSPVSELAGEIVENPDEC